MLARLAQARHHHHNILKMPTTYIKTRASGANGVNGASFDVPTTVRDVISDIRIRGDSAVRSYSEKFDKWSPKSLKLSQQDIDSIIAKVPKQTVDDILTVQENVRTFALEQRKTIVDMEMEIRPGVHLGHKNIPISSVGA